MKEILENILEMTESFKNDENPQDLYDRLQKIESYAFKRLSENED